MKFVAPLFLAALVLVGASCGPHRRHHGGPCWKGGPHGHMAMQGCGPESCTYDDDCFSAGAMRSNAGVCQQCSGGTWVASTGCTTGDCGKCGKCGKAPCGKGDRGKWPCPYADRKK
jgi:hypothetical protein